MKGIRSKFEALRNVMDERVTRLWAASEAQSLGHGGIAAVMEATGISKSRIRAGIFDLKEHRQSPPTGPARRQRVRRRPGAGRPPLIASDPTLIDDLDGLVEPAPRTRLWRAELQRFADASGLDVSVSHFPPGTSKWNKIEHRLFSQITQDWRGRPLVSRETVVELIRATTTQSGLHVRANLDTRTYQVKKKVTAQQIGLVRIKRAHFRGEWNYTVRSAKQDR